MKVAQSPITGGARLAAAAVLLFMLVPMNVHASAWNFTQVSYNETQEPIVVTSPYLESIIGLLAVIAFCNFMQLLMKFQSWILGGEKKDG